MDLGYAYFHNYLGMGENEIYDESGNNVVVVNSSEAVTSNCLGVRGFDILSLGVSFKRYDSRLAPGIGGPERPNDGIAKGYAFDLGMRINKKFDMWGLFYINPSIGVSALNLGNDSAQYYQNLSHRHPLPRIAFVGGSCELNLLDFFGYTFVGEAEYNLLKKFDKEIHHFGHKIQLTPFYALIRGKMVDPAGSRFERTEGFVFTVNFRKTYMMISKMVRFLDMLNNTDYHSKLQRCDNTKSFCGFELKPNFFFSKSHSVIHGTKSLDHLREGQTRDDWSIGIGITGGLSAPDKKWRKSKKGEEKNSTADKMILN